MRKQKPSLLVTVDVLNKKVLGFVKDGVEYRVEGECLRCGKCCEGKCHWFDRDKNGLGICLLHGRSKPWDCFLYPATRDPALPLTKGCGYRIVRVG